MNYFFWKYIHISDQSACARWAAGLFLSIILFSFAGSGGSIGVVLMLIFSLNYWFYADIKLNKTEKITTYIVLFYLSVALFIGYWNENGLASMWLGLSNIGLIALIFLIPVIRYCHVAKYEKWIQFAFPISGILMLIGVLIEFAILPNLGRASVLSGNALILAFTASISALGSMVFGYYANKKHKIFFLLGFLSSIVTLFASGSRGSLVAAVVLCAGYMIYKSINNRTIKPTLIAILSIAILSFFFTVANESKPIQKLIDRTIPLYDILIHDNPIKKLDKSTRMRISYFITGSELVKDNLILGIGRSNLMEKAKQHAPKNQQKWYTKTHLHNGFLSQAVSNGVLGLVSLVILLLLPLFLARKSVPQIREYSFLLTTFLFIYSAFNISFYHDIMIFLFVIQCVFISLYKNYTHKI